MAVSVALRHLASLICACALPAWAAVEVNQFASGGNGTAVAPWTGWDTAIAWSGDTEYAFPSGYYAYAASPNFLKPGIALKGEAGTVLQFRGIGNAVVFDNKGGQSSASERWTRNVRMENFVIEGNGSTTNGLFLRGIRSGQFRHIAVRDVTNAGVWIERVSSSSLDNIRVTRRETAMGSFSVVPSYGIVLTSQEGEGTTGMAITNPVIEGVSSIGIWVKAGSARNTILNGASQANAGKGMQLDGNNNSIVGTLFRSNGGSDLEITGDDNALRNVASEGMLHVRSGRMNQVSGRFYDFAISDAAASTNVFGARIAATFIDYGADTIKYGNQVLPTIRSRIGEARPGGVPQRAGAIEPSQQSFIGNTLEFMFQLYPVEGLISTDARAGSLFWVPLYDNAVLTNPTNGVDGVAITWRFRQDVVGGRELRFGMAFESLGGTMPQLRQAPFSYTEMTARYNAKDQKWQFP